LRKKGVTRMSISLFKFLQLEAITLKYIKEVFYQLRAAQAAKPR